MGNPSFDYNKEAFLEAKQLALFAANTGATANASLQSSDVGIDGDPYTYYGTGSSAYLNTAFVDAPHSTDFPEIDYDLIKTAKQGMKDAYLKLYDLNESMYAMVEAISAELDPDLAEEIKKIEQETAKEYLNLALEGNTVLDALQIYELLRRCDLKEMGLTAQQEELFNFLLKSGEDIKTANAMKWYERLGTGLAVFGLSVAEGVIKVGEQVVDGAITLTGAGIGLGAYLIAGEDARDVVLATSTKLVDVDYAGDWYDKCVEDFGLNGYMAYGDIHKAGLCVGKVTGNMLLNLVPGGAATKAAIAACKSAGTSMEKTAGVETVTEVDRYQVAALAGGLGGFGSAAGSAIGLYGEMAKVDPVLYNPAAEFAAKTGVRFVTTAGNSYLDYRYSGEDNYLEFLGEKGDDYVGSFIGGTAADAIGVQSRYQKSEWRNNPDSPWVRAKGTLDKKGKVDTWKDSAKAGVKALDGTESSYLGHATEGMSQEVTETIESSVEFGGSRIE